MVVLIMGIIWYFMARELVYGFMMRLNGSFFGNRIFMIGLIIIL